MLMIYDWSPPQGSLASTAEEGSELCASSAHLVPHSAPQGLEKVPGSA